MSTDLSKHRMSTMDWVDQYIASMGVHQFIDFERRVNSALDKLRPGRHYEISTSIKPSDQELFIKFCCCYINRHPHYEMSDDYCRIHNKTSL